MSHDVTYLGLLIEQGLAGTAGFSVSFPRKHDERLFSSGNSVSVVPKVTLIIVYWSNNSVRLSRIQGRGTTMGWTKHTGTVGKNQLWVKIVILEVIKGTLDMLRQNIRWWVPPVTLLLFLPVTLLMKIKIIQQHEIRKRAWDLVIVSRSMNLLCALTFTIISLSM